MSRRGGAEVGYGRRRTCNLVRARENIPKERSRTRTAAAQTIVDSDGRCSLSSFATSIVPSERAGTEGSGHDHGLGWQPPLAGVLSVIIADRPQRLTSRDGRVGLAYGRAGPPLSTPLNHAVDRAQTGLAKRTAELDVDGRLVRHSSGRSHHTSQRCSRRRIPVRNSRNRPASPLAPATSVPTALARTP